MPLQLNQYQEEAANHLDGPCLVTSCPGSGKTFTLVERIVRLIRKGINPRTILCLTFTNKAANEMKQRICDRLDIEDPEFFIGTFHSLCVRLIRRLGPGRGYASNFSIIDDRDQADLISQIARRRGLDLDSRTIYRIVNAVNEVRDQMEGEDHLDQRLTDGSEIGIGVEYLQRCRDHNMIDFSGLIYEAIKIIESDPDVTEKVQNTFRYILVDEAQDTNQSQFHLVKLLGAKYRNIMLIGDVDQCVTEDSLISTPKGKRKASSIWQGSLVLAGSGTGRISDATVEHVYERLVENYDIVKVTTHGGREFSCTKEHIVFADYVKSSPKKIIVYLMYQSKLGFRIGVTNTKRKHGLNGMGIGARLQQERADKLWILKSLDSIAEAKYWEHFYSITYGIPSWCFHTGSRGLDYDDVHVKKLFSSVDTVSNAHRLMSDLFLFEERPHYVPKCMGVNKRRNFTVVLCGDARGEKTLHRYNIHGSETSDAVALAGAGLRVRTEKRGRMGWRVESSWEEISEVYNVLQKAQNVVDLNVIEKARLSKESLSFTPASHIREGMAVYVETESGIDIDFVERVEFLKYNGRLFDFDIRGYHNFISDGVVTHNSIYGWRGARYQNIRDFMAENSDCRIICLSKNYRSTPQIVETASKLIRRNMSHMKTPFETDNPSGESIHCYSFPDQYKEGEWVAHMTRRLMNEGGWDPSDVVVLYRVNKMSEPLEQSFAKEGIPYDVIGSWNFYDRREVRDVIAMGKLLVNPKDGISFHRVAGLVNGLGNVTIGHIENMANEKGITLIEASKAMAGEATSKRARAACEKMYEVYSQGWDMTSPSNCFNSLVQQFDYKSYLSDKFPKDGVERQDNVNQVVDSAAEFNGQEDAMSRYLQRISLVTSSDKETKDNRVTLMSLHAAKGLEFPVVFIVGVENDILPHKNALADDRFEGMEEERRLCYVGMTRAKKILYLSYCKNRRIISRWGIRTTRVHPSQFLEEAGLSGE